MKDKHYSLSKAHARKKVREFVDMDYVESLSPENREWLNKFASEFYTGWFKADPIHNTKELKRSCYATNNQRERDLWNKLLRAFDSYEDVATEYTPPEDEDKNG